MFISELNSYYRNVFIIQSRNYWSEHVISFDSTLDIVLTFDFWLKREIEKMGGTAYYIDRLSAPSEMQKNNFLASEFFKKWHYDKFGNDIFTAHAVPFGFSLRIEIWSEYLYYVRLRANLEQLRKLQYETICLGESGNSIGDILREMGMKYTSLSTTPAIKIAYFFDIHKYMHNALHARNLHNVARDFLVKIFSIGSFYCDTIFNFKNKKKSIYVQIYHPTKKIVDYLKKDTNVRVITSSLSKSKSWRTYFAQRLIPIRGKAEQFEEQAYVLLNNFKVDRSASLFLSDGTDATAGAYEVIEKQIQPRIPEALQILNSVNTYLKKQPIYLEIMIANIGLLQTIVDCVLKTNQVPSYLIINGFLGGKFCDDGKYATYINSYSESIKTHYYNNDKNVVCLGDPRMDDYINKAAGQKLINRIAPTISIGSSGFNNLDLISHVAVEFDFMFDILSAFQQLKDEGSKFNLIIKVRPNGFLEQYASFINEYFPKLDVEIVRAVPIREVLDRTDLYISIYSQTLFEASCLGIPVVYYKKDEELLDPPFDKKSELVTVDTVEALKQAFFDFQIDHGRFKAFLDKQVMEKYVGPLDGKNLERNLAFIYDMLDKVQIGETI